MTEVRLYELQPDDSVVQLTGVGLDWLGVCPDLGDKICFQDATGIQFFDVKHRYCIDVVDGGRGWAIILQKCNHSKIDNAVWATWQEDTAFWKDVDRKDEAKKHRDNLAALAQLDKERKATRPKR